MAFFGMRDRPLPAPAQPKGPRHFMCISQLLMSAERADRIISLLIIASLATGQA